MAHSLGRKSRFWLYWRLPNGRTGKLGPFPEAVARPLSTRFRITLFEERNDPLGTTGLSTASMSPWTRQGPLPVD